ncbi:LrgB family protein [Aquibacillus koreensis]|uniref:LrgB family protein n=1 Tax=Aquibacillus koreensis TaxID=279446 RepID=A0A9X3WKZ1_9BACI|nr:LrgB family protein [Aquibacillus koreensis]MCT2534390.1 LrgB family protein [Aquibacillus koreensis]MDC3421697.1 LrgB family protein [Aquibacillus koreensis]
MNSFLIGLSTLTATILLFFLTKKIYKKYPSPFTLPILTSTWVIVVGLLIFDIPYETYMIGGQWLDHLLGPVVVALAYPLYRQWPLLKMYMVPILSGVIVGSFIGISTGFIAAKWLGFSDTIIYSITSKSVTTPVSMDIANTIGGTTPLAAVFVMFAGIGGAVFGPSILKLSRVNLTIAKGVSMGTASHAIGTARSMENSELEAAVSTVSLTISAVIVAMITPTFVHVMMG